MVDKNKNNYFEFTATKENKEFATTILNKTTSNSIYLHLYNESDLKDANVIKVFVIGISKDGKEANCTYISEYYVLERGYKYEVSNTVCEDGYSKVKLLFKCEEGQTIKGEWNSDCVNYNDCISLTDEKGKGNTKEDNFDIIIPSNGIYCTKTRTKGNNSPIYLNLSNCDSNEEIKVIIYGEGAYQGEQNVTYRSPYYKINLGKEYLISSRVKEYNHSGVRIKIEAKAGLHIKATWSPDSDSKANAIQVTDINQNPSTDIRPVGSYIKLIDVPEISQMYEQLPTGCETVSAVMVLHHYKVNVSILDFFNDKVQSSPVGADPDYYFIGSPKDPESYGCFAPCIANAMNKVLPSPYHAIVERGYTVDELCRYYIDKDIPVVLWATIDMANSFSGYSWKITKSYDEERIGKYHIWNCNEHCLVLIGYSEKDYIVNDPWKEKGNVRGVYEKKLFEDRYKQMGEQAVVIIKDEREIPKLSDISNDEATESAKEIGYEQVENCYVKGQRVFRNKKEKKYIVRDIGEDRKKGSVWKVANSVNDIVKHNYYKGIYDKYLNKISS